MKRCLIIKYYGVEKGYDLDTSIRNVRELKHFIQSRYQVSDLYQLIEYDSITLNGFLNGHITTISIQLKNSLSFSSIVSPMCAGYFHKTNDFNKQYFDSNKSGYYKFGLDVSKYGDYSWLQKGNGEWKLTTYHGTSFSNAMSIIKSGYSLAKCRTPGIYSSTEFETALGYTQKDQNELKYSVVLKNRISPQFGIQNGVIIVNIESYIRPYAIIIKIVR